MNTPTQTPNKKPVTGRVARKHCQATAKSEAKLEALRKQEPAVRKILRKAAILSDLITEEDLEQDAQVIRDACDAMHHIFDPKLKCMVSVPDHRTRLAAVTLRRAYVEGTPVHREIKFTKEFRSVDENLATLRESPEGMRTLRALSALGVGLEINGETIAANELEGVQKTGA